MSKVVDFGVSGTTCAFSSPVRLLFPGQAGKKAGYATSSGGTLTEITTICDSTTAPTNVTGAVTDCKVDCGSDLCVFTKHVTYFGIYSQTAQSSGSGGGSFSFGGLLINNILSPLTDKKEIMAIFQGLPADALEYALSESPFGVMVWKVLPSIQNGVSQILYTLSGGNGIYTLYGKVRTKFGIESSNVGTASVTLNTALELEKISTGTPKSYTTDSPAAEVSISGPVVLSPFSGQILTTLPFVLKGIASGGADVSITIAATTYTVTTDASGAFEVTILDQLVPGTYQITLLQKNTAGKTSAVVSRIVTYAPKIFVPSIEKKLKPVFEPELEKETETKTEKPIKVEEEVSKLRLKPQPKAQSVTPIIPVKIDTQKISATVEEVEEVVAEAKARDSFLLILQKNTSQFYKEQLNTIHVINGKEVEVLVRPPEEVHSITGRLYPKGKVPGQIKSISRQRFFRAIANEVFAKEEEDGWIKAYRFEPLGSGNIYKGVIDVPAGDSVEAYELVLIFNEKDGERLKVAKSVVTTAPGKIVEKGNEPVEAARVELFAEDIESNSYRFWDASLFGQDNPQVTRESGEYVFQVPAGSYYVKVQAPRHTTYQSGIYLFSEPGIVHDTITLQSAEQSWWQVFWNWAKEIFR